MRRPAARPDRLRTWSCAAHAHAGPCGRGTRAARLLVALALLVLTAVLTACAVAAASASAAPAPAARAPHLAPCHAGTATSRGVPAVVLAQDHGLLLTGKAAALRGRPAPALESLDETQTAALAALPSRNVFLRGAECDWGGRTSRFAAPLTLTFTLPKALFRDSTLPLFRYDGVAWRRQPARAVVGRVNTTASAAITRPGSYALLLTTAWKVTTVEGEDLVQYQGATPSTDVRDPVVVATGTTSDPAVIAATMLVASCSEEQAVSTLHSFDSTTAPVSIVSLSAPAAMERYWSGTSTVGRWFAHSGGPLLSPAEARRVHALPASNTGTDITLHEVRGGVSLITGLCADMTGVQGYGPWATGGGWQYFGPKVSTYPPPLYDPAAITTLADLRWEKDAVDAVQW